MGLPALRGRWPAAAALLLTALLMPSAGGYRVHISLAREQNAWWRSIVHEFGGECAQVCSPVDKVGAALAPPRPPSVGCPPAAISLRNATARADRLGDR